MRRTWPSTVRVVHQLATAYSPSTQRSLAGEVKPRLITIRPEGSNFVPVAPPRAGPGSCVVARNRRGRQARQHTTQPCAGERANRKRVGNRGQGLTGLVPVDQTSDLVRSADLYGADPFGGLRRAESGDLRQEEFDLVARCPGVGVKRSEMDQVVGLRFDLFAKLLPGLLGCADAHLAIAARDLQMPFTSGMTEVAQQHDLLVEQREDGGAGGAARRHRTHIRAELAIWPAYGIAEHNHVRVLVDHAGSAP